MKKIATPVEGVFILEPQVFGDSRGWFMESWNKSAMEREGLFYDFVQDNHSFSAKKGTLRGLHLQWAGAELSAENFRQLLIPRGCAHGFVTLTDDVQFLYKADNYYNKESEGSIRWNDPSLGIAWGVENPVLSDKDAAAPLFDACALYF